jgi:hypothetical protein
MAITEEEGQTYTPLSLTLKISARRKKCTHVSENSQNKEHLLP